MKVVKAFGGLGNQMFQYAFYHYLKLNNDDVYFDIGDYSIHDYHNGFELSRIFQVDFDEPSKEELRKLTVKHESAIVRLFNKFFNLRITRPSEIFESKELMIITNHKSISNALFRGTWQNILYVKPVEDEIRRKFKFPEFIEDKNMDLARFISANNCVSVHIRRGDYLNTHNLNGICDEEYYRRALEYVISKSSELKYIFFSDDIQWCREQYAGLEAIFVDWNSGNESYKDMQLMSLCNHNIIANSSFSWWGAFLNINPHKIVVMPEMWDSNVYHNTLVYPGWSTVEMRQHK